MWEWFITNGVWILITVLVGLVLFYFLRRWASRVVEKVIPKQWHEQLKGAQRMTTWVIIGIGGVILALAVAGVIVSRYGVDITPALETVGGWLLEHGILILVIILLSYLAYIINWGPFLISKTPWLLRVDAFEDSGIIIKVVGETQPIKQWDVMGELRRRIKKVFDEEGIEIPWPHVKLYLGQSQVDKHLTCKACSHLNLPGSKFCSACGASLTS